MADLNFKIWIDAARPKTLPATVAVVLIQTGTLVEVRSRNGN